VKEGRQKRQIYLKDWFISIKNEIRNLKYSNREEIEDLNSKYVILSAALKKLLGLMSNQRIVIDTLNIEKNTLYKAIEEQNKKISLSSQKEIEHIKEIELVKKKNVALKEELALKIHAERDLISLRQDYDKILLDNESYILNAEMLTMENKKMKSKFGKMEINYGEVSIYSLLELIDLCTYYCMSVD
jgi:prolyl oligopeptidase PreP (S9A serine peptidase family)